jgi:predicted O-linked N-acetylglucosamine transferase (SPINDLY family)
MSAVLNRKLKRAHEYLRQGDAARARALCEEALRSAPRNPEAYYLLGLARLAEGQAGQALAPLMQALAADPRHGPALEYLGLAHLMLGQFGEAESVLTRAAALPGAPASVLMRLGIAILEQGRASEALPALRRAAHAAPGDPDCRLNLGRALAQAGDPDGARGEFEAILRSAPDHPDATFNLGVLALEAGRFAEARLWFEQVLRASPGYVDAMISLGIVLQKQSRLDDAADCLRRALALDRSNAAAGSELARTLALQGMLEEAREGFHRVLQASPRFIPAHEGLASVCIALNRLGEGIEHLRATLEAEPGNSGAASALSGALFEAGQLEEAEALAQRAIQADPGAAAAYATLANLHLVRGRLDAAVAMLEDGYERTRESVLLGMLTYQLRQACDWTKWQAAWTEMAPELERGAALGSPFWLLCEPTTAAQQLAYTRRWAEARFKAVSPGTRPVATRPRRARLRVGYLSSDFQEHAVGHLIVEALELHDRERFEVYGYSHGPARESPMRGRLRAACEHFIDIGRETDDAAAARIRGDELDVLVDLKGYTVGDRLAVMARRPCRVQLAWLGYPGTTGAPFIDYLIADPFLIPPDGEPAYSERIVRLPHCYQPSDRKRDIAEPLSRRDYGIPDGAFAFCCFNQTYKIAPDIFAAWMRLLSRVPDSVLWLLDCNGLARHNLVEDARRHGVAPGRLVFGPPLPNAAHLARYRVAELALDTFPYTSHTTLSDALWCGCPAVGFAGETFASRVSGSILTAAGLADLVTYSLSDYEALAGRLAVEPRSLEETRARVARARVASPLFDTAAFTRDLEKIYLDLAGNA